MLRIRRDAGRLFHKGWSARKISRYLGYHYTAIMRWIEFGEKTFNFKCYASVWFEKGYIDTKRSILQALGTNLRLKDKKLAVDIHPFFIPFIEH